MAVLSAIILNAKWSINFSGQYVVTTGVEERYRDITGLMKEYRGTVFYYAPAYCEQDVFQYEHIKNINCVKTILFRGHKHAETMFPGNMCYIIDKDHRELLKLYERYENRKVSKMEFLLSTVPFTAFFKIMRREIKSFLVRRMGKYSNDI